VTFGTAPATGSYVSIYMVSAPDGTNYSDGSGTVDPGDDTLILDIPLRSTNQAQLKMTDWFPLPPCKLKFLLENNSDKNFPSGAYVELFTCNFELQ